MEQEVPVAAHCVDIDLVIERGGKPSSTAPKRAPKPAISLCISVARRACDTLL